MSDCLVEGGVPLRGDVTVSGSKNAALPVIFATLLTDGVSTIESLPNIGDVNTALSIISDMGAVVHRRGSVVTVDTTRLTYSPPDPKKAASLRASTYLIGACLARFGRVDLVPFGGCNFSLRPIDLHLYAAECFGAHIGEGMLRLPSPTAAEVHLRLPSVGATVNAILMAASIEGETVITGSACEPHVRVLLEFLASAGASFDFDDSGKITVRGGRLGGGRIRIPGDMIEAGSYLTLSMLTGGRVRVFGADRNELSSFFLPFVCSGAHVLEEQGALVMEGDLHRAVDIVTAPYPGYPTDLQPIAAPVLASFFGGTIRDTVWQSRYGYLSALGELGLVHSINCGCARILPSKLHSGSLIAPDLRGGIAAMLLALSVKGVSRIGSAQTVLRGYDSPVEKLQVLGARVIIKNG